MVDATPEDYKLAEEQMNEELLNLAEVEIIE